MQAAVQNDYVTVEDYLAAEEASEVRHEYLGGLVYAMAGETRAHNQITGNLYLAIRQHLKGGPCKLYMSDIRVNLSLREDAYYCYPDLVVTCDPRDTDPRFIRHPKLIIEVMSPSTERVDKREKFFAYTTMESLEEYVLIAQTTREVTLFRRGNGWRSEKVSGPDAQLTLASLQLALPLTGVYEGV
jgi:Uma2 family endonuclease